MKTSNIDRLLFVFFLIQVIFYFILFNDLSLILGLGLNSILIIYCIRIVNYKITHPLFIGAVFFYLTFNLPIFYFAAINQIDASGTISFYFNKDVQLFSKAAWLINIALIGYVLGNFKTIRKRKKTRVKNKYNFFIKKITTFESVTLIVWFLISGFIRVTYKLGAAGQEADIAYTGILQHLFYTGNLVLFSLYFLSGLDRKNKSKLFFIVISASVLIFTQVILGWRGTAFSIFVLCTFIYLIFDNPNKVAISKPLVIISLLMLPVFTFIGNSYRSQALTGVDTEYASNTEEFFEKVFFRQQGLTRLLVVLDNNSNSFLTNNFFIKELNNNKITATKYIDEYYFGIKYGAKNSTGGSGPGCTFLMGGALFTFLIFFGTGVVLSYFYRKMLNSTKILYLIIYSNLVVLFRSLLAENFGLYLIKSMIVILLFSYGWFYVLNILKNEK
jgi:oligosaccharide repeat unit polymerase